jgi:hypothetical protein
VSVAGARDPDFHGQRGRNVDDVVATSDQNLRDATAEVLGSFDRVPSFGPALRPCCRRGGGPGIDHEPSGGDGGAVVVDGYRGERGLVRIDSYDDHRAAFLR